MRIEFLIQTWEFLAIFFEIIRAFHVNKLDRNYVSLLGEGLEGLDRAEVEVGSEQETADGRKSDEQSGSS